LIIFIGFLVLVFIDFIFIIFPRKSKILGAPKTPLKLSSELKIQ